MKRFPGVTKVYNDFYFALLKNDVGHVREILFSGRLNPLEMNDWGQTPLLLACEYGCELSATSVLDVNDTGLFRTKHDINHQGKFEMTPLMFACMRRHEKVVYRLLKYPGINMRTQDMLGATAMYFATTTKFGKPINPTIIGMLLSKK